MWGLLYNDMIMVNSLRRRKGAGINATGSPGRSGTSSTLSDDTSASVLISPDRIIEGVSHDQPPGKDTECAAIKNDDLLRPMIRKHRSHEGIP